MKLLIRSVFALLILIGVLALFTIGRVDRTPLEQTAHHLQMQTVFDSIRQSMPAYSGDTVRAGWAKVSLLPGQPSPMAGYGIRKGAPATGTNDSLWVKAFVFSNGLHKAAIVSADLLIIAPEVTRYLAERLPSIGFSFQQTFLTATHTHCAPGGWGKGTLGELFAGDYNPEAVAFVAEAILKAIAAAEQSMEKVEIGMWQVEAPQFVKNRLVGDQGPTDPLMRGLALRRADSTSALLITYAGHATCLSQDFMQFSADYPGVLTAQMERLPGISFAAFSAGAVGSHAPRALEDGLSEFAFASAVGKGLADLLSAQLGSVRYTYQRDLYALQMPLPLGEPQMRFAANWRIRPWLFRMLSGEPLSGPAYTHHVSVLRLGDLLMVGLPCDFSGELMPMLDAEASLHNRRLIVTSFNGGYIGYITEDSRYDLDTYETRVMNWYGPYNGTYFSDVIRNLFVL